MGIEYNGGPRVLNGLTGATQTFAVASSGTDFGIASSGTAHTFSIPDAGASARGLVTTGAQTFAGAKTFSGAISASNLSGTNTGDQNLSSYLTSATAATTYAPIAAGQPISGTVGQVLTKNSGTNYDSSWTSLVLGDRYLSTSTTSNAVSNGTKTFTIGTGLSYTPTQNITIAYDATHHMHGEVTTYNSGTGVLVVDINNHTGTGTYTSWVVNVGGVTPATSVAWGSITGTLGSQSDLSTALSAKLETTTAASTYVPLTRTLNTLALSADQTFAVGTGGTDFAIASSGTAHTFNIPDASATARGLITTGTQTIAGAKRFNNPISGYTDSTDFTAQLYLHNATSTARPSFGLARSKGTEASKTAVANADYIGSFMFSGYDGTAYQTTAMVLGIVDGSVSSLTVPQSLQFITGTTEANRAARLTISSAGAATFSSAVAISSAANLTFNSTGGLVFGAGGLIYDDGALAPYFRNNGIRLQGSGLDYTNTGIFWGATLSTAMSLRSDNSATVLALRGGTTAQTFRVYNTYTSSTSGEYGQASWVSNEFRIGTAVGSAGGTQRKISLGTTNSAGTWTSIATLDVSNNSIGIGVASPSAPIHIARNSSMIVMRASDPAGVAHGMTDIAPTDTFFSLEQYANASGGTIIRSLTDGTSVGSPALFFVGVAGEASVTACPVIFRAGKKSGTTYGALSASEPAIGFDNYSTRLMTILGGGNVGIGTTSPTSLLHLTQPVSTSDSPTAFTLTGGAHTTLALSTEATDVNFNLARTVQFATGAITTQRAMRIQAPTYSFVGASTITTASTLSISGAPVAGTNATISTAFSLYSEGGLVGSVGDVVVTTATGAFGVRSGPGGSNRIQMKGGTGLEMAAACYVAWGPNSTNLNSLDVYIYRDTAGTLALRNAANVQSFGVYGTWTSTTSYERINVRGKASANFEIGPENGSAGGTRRGLTIGGYYDGSATITPWLSFTSGGDATFANPVAFSHANGVTVNGSCWVSTFGANAGFRNLRANGTSGSPTRVLEGDVLGFYSARGYYDDSGGAYHTTHGGYWGFTAAQDFTSGAQGTTFALQTTSAGAATPTERLFIDSAGVAIFAGEVRVPTASPGTNTTQAASTAFVTAAVAAGGGGITAAKVLSYSLLRR